MLDPNIELLQAVSLFRGLDEKQLRAILAITQKTFFQSGEELIAKNEIGNTAYLIISGTARCYSVQYAPAAEEVLERGALVGQFAMITETLHDFSVRAVERIRALAIRRASLRKVMEADPQIAQQISDNLLIRLRGLASELRQFDGRLAAMEKTGTFGAQASWLRLQA
jgi:CRP-like cAMP-binding protein